MELRHSSVDNQMVVKGTKLYITRPRQILLVADLLSVYAISHFTFKPALI